jgi:hypothetical protein
MQFIRLVAGWSDNVIAPNNILRELALTRSEAPDVPLVALGGESYLFDSLAEMSDAFDGVVRSSERTTEVQRYWGIEILRALVLLLGNGVNFAFIEGAFSPPLETEVEGEEVQTLLDAFEAAAPPGIHNDTDDEGEDEDDTFNLGHDDDDDDDDDIPYFYFPASRRSSHLHPERDAGKNVPIVPHRKIYSGHCNIQTVPLPISLLQD